MSYSKKTKLRIVSDILDIQKSNLEGIHIHIDKKNFHQVKALIIGPKNTPYANGFYFFSITFPKNYPDSPPKVIMNKSKARMNPNLYADGKVCLSIINTWNGPSWKPIMNLKLVLISIQSLMNEFPIQNEPGYEKVKPDNYKSIHYNSYVIYHNYRDFIINVLKKNNTEFNEIIKKHFDENKEQLYNNLLSYKQTIGNINLKPTIYFMKEIKFNFDKLIKDFDNL